MRRFGSTRLKNPAEKNFPPKQGAIREKNRSAQSTPTMVVTYIRQSTNKYNTASTRDIPVRARNHGIAIAVRMLSECCPNTALSLKLHQITSLSRSMVNLDHQNRQDTPSDRMVPVFR